MSISPHISAPTGAIEHRTGHDFGLSQRSSSLLWMLHFKGFNNIVSCASLIALVITVASSCGSSQFFGFSDPRENGGTDDPTLIDKTGSSEETETDGSLPERGDDNELAENDASESPSNDTDDDPGDLSEDGSYHAPAPSVVYAAPQTEVFNRDTLLQDFSTDFNTKEIAVDLLFVIDNSMSMTNELEQVHKNIGGFLNRLSSLTHTNIGVLTSITPSHQYNAFPISPTDHPHISFINQRVRSYNSLYLTSLFLTDDIKTTTGQRGSDFFREDSLKVFVVVTDHDSLDYSAQEFATTLQQNFPLEDVRFFGFITLPNSDLSAQVPLYLAPSDERTAVSCSGTIPSNVPVTDIPEAPGRIYHDILAEHLSGALFDVCQKDWSPHFDKIAGFVAKEVKTHYPLSQDPQSVTSVTVDGVEVFPEHVNISDGSLIFLNNVLPKDRDAQIRVRYHRDTPVEIFFSTPSTPS